jgi:hypothetical protein
MELRAQTTGPRKQTSRFRLSMRCTDVAMRVGEARRVDHCCGARDWVMISLSFEKSVKVLPISNDCEHVVIARATQAAYVICC